LKGKTSHMYIWAHCKSVLPLGELILSSRFLSHGILGGIVLWSSCLSSSVILLVIESAVEHLRHLSIPHQGRLRYKVVTATQKALPGDLAEYHNVWWLRRFRASVRAPRSRSAHSHGSRRRQTDPNAWSHEARRPSKDTYTTKLGRSVVNSRGLSVRGSDCENGIMVGGRYRQRQKRQH
jgi:hypothetical protein